MKTDRKIGIWLDHSSAHLIEYTAEPLATSVVQSKFTHLEKKKTIEHGEKRMHQKENHQQHEYYELLVARIKEYQEVLLFGPTDAKLELHKLLKKDHTADKINVVVLDADKMTDNQLHAYVKSYFETHHQNHQQK